MYTCVYMCVCMQVYFYTCIHTNTYIYTYKHAHIFISICIYTCIPYTYVHAHVCTYAEMALMKPNARGARISCIIQIQASTRPSRPYVTHQDTQTSKALVVCQWVCTWSQWRGGVLSLFFITHSRKWNTCTVTIHALPLARFVSLRFCEVCSVWLAAVSRFGVRMPSQDNKKVGGVGHIQHRCCKHTNTHNCMCVWDALGRDLCAQLLSLENGLKSWHVIWYSMLPYSAIRWD